MFSFGFVEDLAGTMRNSILALMVYFIIAFVLILFAIKKHNNRNSNKIALMKLYTIDTGFFKLDGGAMFGVVPKVCGTKEPGR